MIHRTIKYSKKLFETQRRGTMIIDDMPNIEDTVFIFGTQTQEERRSLMICQTFRTLYISLEDKHEE